VSSPSSQTDDAAAAARAILAELLADVPQIAIGAAALDALQHYVALLLDANARLNLTRVTEPGDVARLHLLRRARRPAAAGPPAVAGRG